MGSMARNVLRRVAASLQVERRAWTSTATLFDILGDQARIRGSAMAVTSKTAMRHAAVYACRDLLVRQCATMSVGVFRMNGPQLMPVQPQPQVVANPSPMPSVDRVAWVAQLIDSLVMRGNAFGLVTERTSNGWPNRVELISPDLVSYQPPSVATDEGTWRVMGREVRLWQEGGELWHLPRFPPPGTPLGLSVLQSAQETMGLGLQAQKFAAEWFANGAHPSGLFSVDTPEVTDEQAKVIKQRLVDVTQNHSPLVLGSSAKYQQMQVAPEESQFLQTINANDVQIARFFGVPPEKIGASSGSSMKYANIESWNVNYLVDTIDPLLVLIEGAWSDLLPRPQLVRFDRSSLLRTDTNARLNGYAVGIAAGVYTVNEARAKEGLPPVDGGDAPAWLRPAPAQPMLAPSNQGDK